jgi:hypothetical protein
MGERIALIDIFHSPFEDAELKQEPDIFLTNRFEV